MRSSSAISLWSFLATLTAASTCADDQATDWESTVPVFKTPSAPWNCHSIYTATVQQSLDDVRREFEITPYELLSWNCFLTNKGELLDAGDKICINASLPEVATSTINDLAVRTGLAPQATTSWPSFFTEACDAFSDAAEDCRVTKQCDASKREYPTCVNGTCECKAVPCSKTSECEPHNQCPQCRSDDEEFVCLPEPNLYPKFDGICQCRPKVTGCMLEGDEKHLFCSERLDCTEPHFSLFPEFAQCVMNRPDSGHRRQGQCECQSVDCQFVAGKGDDDFCMERVDCTGKGEPVCSIKYGPEEPGQMGGYCTCSDAW